MQRKVCDAGGSEKPLTVIVDENERKMPRAQTDSAISSKYISPFKLIQPATTRTRSKKPMLIKNMNTIKKPQGMCCGGILLANISSRSGDGIQTGSRQMDGQ